MGKFHLRSSSGNPRQRLSKGAAVRRDKMLTRSLVTPSTPPSRVVDEDSGFEGDSTSDIESAKTTSSALVFSTPIVRCSTVQSKHKLLLPAKDTRFGSKAKRLKVELEEEMAQGLPDVTHVGKQGLSQQVLSFGNVPVILPAAGGALTYAPQNALVCNLPKSIASKEKLMSHNLSSVSSDGTIELKLLVQPERQHRARYLTEGSRGAVKDEEGEKFPVVQLLGYNKPTALQVFVGSDSPKVGPHMFYQASKVYGKSSTPCREVKKDGTVVIEIPIEPENDMTVSCDCVGILKERNVDVEQRCRSQDSSAVRGRKKSTKCRLIYRASVVLTSGKEEILQVVSHPISCTQPPGLPEISKMSLSKCSVLGGEQLFIIGKNFLKDTKVIFKERDDEVNSFNQWSQMIEPEKEFLQSTHLICEIPKYRSTDITMEVKASVVVISGGKQSEAHHFLYIPNTEKVSVATSWISLPVDETTDKMKTECLEQSHTELNSPSEIANRGCQEVKSTETVVVPDNIQSGTIEPHSAMSQQASPLVPASFPQVNLDKFISASGPATQQSIPTTSDSLLESSLLQSSIISDEKEKILCFLKKNIQITLSNDDYLQLIKLMGTSSAAPPSHVSLPDVHPDIISHPSQVKCVVPGIVRTVVPTVQSLPTISTSVCQQAISCNASTQPLQSVRGYIVMSRDDKKYGKQPLQLEQSYRTQAGICTESLPASWSQTDKIGLVSKNSGISVDGGHVSGSDKVFLDGYGTLSAVPVVTTGVGLPAPVSASLPAPPPQQPHPTALPGSTERNSFVEGNHALFSELLNNPVTVQEHKSSPIAAFSSISLDFGTISSESSAGTHLGPNSFRAYDSGQNPVPEQHLGLPVNRHNNANEMITEHAASFAPISVLQSTHDPLLSQASQSITYQNKRAAEDVSSSSLVQPQPVVSEQQQHGEDFIFSTFHEMREEGKFI